MDDKVALRDTILDTLRQAAEACSTLARFILEAANHLRAGDIRAGNELLSQVLDDFSQLVQFLEDVRRTKALVDEGRQPSIDALDRESREMADLLNMAVNAQENQDWVFLADILEYEFSQKVASWDGLLRGLSDPGGARAAL